MNKACCSFDDYLEAFLKAARDYKVPLLLINWHQARRDWRKGFTGLEGLLAQRNELSKEVYYSNQSDLA